MICVGTDMETSAKAVELASKNELIWAAVGIHPNDISGNESFNKTEFKKLAQSNKVVAIGEIGLDYYRTTDSEKRKLQKKILEAELTIAQELRKSVIIHCRDGVVDVSHARSPDLAHTVMTDVLGGRRFKNRIRGVIHSFTGTWAQASGYIDLGFYIGFNGIITFTHQYDSVVTNVPLERILLETDAPFLTPVPHRGQRNEPTYVRYVAEHLAELRGISYEEVIETTTQNAKKLFGV